jgi:hypothetical protein
MRLNVRSACAMNVFAIGGLQFHQLALVEFFDHIETLLHRLAEGMSSRAEVVANRPMTACVIAMSSCTRLANSGSKLR